MCIRDRCRIRDYTFIAQKLQWTTSASTTTKQLCSFIRMLNFTVLFLSTPTALQAPVNNLLYGNSKGDNYKANTAFEAYKHTVTRQPYWLTQHMMSTHLTGPLLLFSSNSSVAIVKFLVPSPRSLAPLKGSITPMTGSHQMTKRRHSVIYNVHRPLILSFRKNSSWHIQQLEFNSPRAT